MEFLKKPLTRRIGCVAALLVAFLFYGALTDPRLAGFVAALWLYGCERTAPVEESPSLPTGYWQAAITLPGGNISPSTAAPLPTIRVAASASSTGP